MRCPKAHCPMRETGHCFPSRILSRCHPFNHCVHKLRSIGINRTVAGVNYCSDKMFTALAVVFLICAIEAYPQMQELGAIPLSRPSCIFPIRWNIPETQKNECKRQLLRAQRRSI